MYAIRSYYAMLAKDMNARLILERFEDNPFLPDFYKDIERFAFATELSFMADRYQQLSEVLAQPDLFTSLAISDYYFMKSLIFASATLSNNEYRLYRRLFDIMMNQLPKPDLLVYLYRGSYNLLEHIKRRNRDYEKMIDTKYLENIHQSYMNFFTQSTLPIAIIEIDGIDFVQNTPVYNRIKTIILNHKFKSGITRFFKEDFFD